MDSQQQEALRSWLKFLNPETLRANLIAASLFLTAYEMLMKSLVGRIRDFYCFGFDANGPKVSPSYERKVLSLHKEQLTASLLWLKDNQVVDDADFALVDQIRRHRNEIAHELPRFLMTVSAEINLELLASLYVLITKVDRWWIREVEIPINPDFDGQEIDEGAIQSGNMMWLKMMMQIAAGDDAEWVKAYEHFCHAH